MENCEYGIPWLDTKKLECKKTENCPSEIYYGKVKYCTKEREEEKEREEIRGVGRKIE